MYVKHSTIKRSIINITKLLSLFIILAIQFTMSGCGDISKRQTGLAESKIDSKTETIHAESTSQTSDTLSKKKPSDSSSATTAAISIRPNDKQSTNKTSDSSNNNITNTKEKKISQVTLLATGDNLIHIQVIESGRRSDGTYNFNHLYALVKKKISAADIAVVNQETILGGKSLTYSGYPTFNSPTEIGDALVNAGFDVVLHATNHTMDKGVKGINNTLSYWGTHKNIKVLGINKNKQQKNSITIIKKNGIKLALLNYTYSLNGYSLPKNMPYLVNMLDRNQIRIDVKKAKKLADFVVVFPHWGTEYQYKPSPQQNEFTKLFYDLGVDLVIGSHPHVLEPVKWIKTKKNHKMLVYYSLGNFISYQREAPRMLGGIAEVTITKDKKGTYISKAGITPIVVHYENNTPKYHYGIYELSEYNDKLASAHSVSSLATQGPLTYKGIYNLAEQVLGSWFKD